MKKEGKVTRPFRYDINQIPNDYTVEVTNRFKCLKVGERSVQEPQNPKKDMVVKPWVFFLPCVSRLYTGYVSNLETPTDIDQKYLIKCLLSVTKVSGKGQLRKKEIVKQQPLDSVLHHRKVCLHP